MGRCTRDWEGETWCGECGIVGWETEGFRGYLKRVWAGRRVGGGAGTGSCGEKGGRRVALKELFLDGTASGVGLETSAD